MIVLNAVESSNIDGIGYDKQTKELYVKFLSETNDNIYIYEDVPQNIYDRFTAAQSHGSYLHTNIKEKYTFRLAEDETAYRMNFDLDPID